MKKVLLSLIFIGLIFSVSKASETNPVETERQEGYYYSVSILWGLINTHRCQPCECTCYIITVEQGESIQVGTPVEVTIYPSTGAQTRSGTIISFDSNGSPEVYVNP
jgi:hypothetical protein